jgi:hypothetical protein
MTIDIVEINRSHGWYDSQELVYPACSSLSYGGARSAMSGDTSMNTK